MVIAVAHLDAKVRRYTRGVDVGNLEDRSKNQIWKYRNWLSELKLKGGIKLKILQFKIDDK